MDNHNKADLFDTISGALEQIAKFNKPFLHPIDRGGARFDDEKADKNKYATTPFKLKHYTSAWNRLKEVTEKPFGDPTMRTRLCIEFKKLPCPPVPPNDPPPSTYGWSIEHGPNEFLSMKRILNPNYDPTDVALNDWPGFDMAPISDLATEFKILADELKAQIQKVSQNGAGEPSKTSNKRAYTQWPKSAQEQVGQLWVSYRDGKGGTREIDCYNAHKGTTRLPDCVKSFDDFKKCKEAAEHNRSIPKFNKTQGKAKGKPCQKESSRKKH